MPQLHHGRLDASETFINLFVSPFEMGHADFQCISHALMIPGVRSFR